MSACASNEASVDTDDSGAEMANEQPAVTEGVSKAEEQVEQTEAPEETAIVTEAEAVTGGSGNLVATCYYEDLVRRITVVYDNEATGKACEVHYEKSTGVQTLWSAINDRDYCMDRAVEFVKKQGGWGWVCSEFEPVK